MALSLLVPVVVAVARYTTLTSEPASHLMAVRALPLPPTHSVYSSFRFIAGTRGDLNGARASDCTEPNDLRRLYFTQPRDGSCRAHCRKSLVFSRLDLSDGSRSPLLSRWKCLPTLGTETAVAIFFFFPCHRFTTRLRARRRYTKLRARVTPSVDCRPAGSRR